MGIPNWKERWVLIGLATYLCIAVYISVDVDVILFCLAVYFAAFTRYFFKYVYWGDSE